MIGKNAMRLRHNDTDEVVKEGVHVETPNWKAE